MRTIGVVTVGRSDYGIYQPILRRIQSDPELKLQLIVGGMHLSPEFGPTVNDIEADGYEIAHRVEMLLSSDTPEGIAKSMGLGIMGFAQAYATSAPDILIVAGDRFEMHAAALAALPFLIPVAHVHGGELTTGAIDDALRHSITKLSHLHFVSTEEYKQRVIQLGEESNRVIVSGAPSLDNLFSQDNMGRPEMESFFGFQIRDNLLLVTYHPVTLEYEQTEWQMRELLEALRECDLPIVFTMPNADTGGRIISSMVEKFVQDYPQAQLISNLGTRAYFSLMGIAAAMVGNSSSGIIEAPSFSLPVVNIGTRQDGRVRASNVLDAGYERSEVLQAIRIAISPEFRAQIQGLPNPYGDGQASKAIVKRLKEVPLDRALVRKNFVDIATPTPAVA